jgi:hypothetical protein
MKKSAIRFLLFLVIISALVGVVGCKSPQTPDTSAVAATYFQHEGNENTGNIIESKYIKLNSDGTWVTNDAQNKTKDHTFKINGEAISLYLGASEFMYGTLKDGKLEGKMFALITWVDVVFFKEAT